MPADIDFIRSIRDSTTPTYLNFRLEQNKEDISPSEGDISSKEDAMAATEDTMAATEDIKETTEDIKEAGLE